MCGCQPRKLSGPVDQLAEGLDAGDHAGQQVVPAQRGAINLPHRFPREPRQLAQQRAVEPEAHNKRWPLFDVTERALEETASEITRVVNARMGIKDEMFY